MTHEEFARGLRLLPVYRASIRALERRPADRWWASMLADCPRKVIYRRRGLVAEMLPDTLPDWARKQLGEGVEEAERRLLELGLPQINHKTLLDVIPSHSKLAEILEYALSEGRLPREAVGPYHIAQLPFLVDLGLKDPVSCRTDFLILAWDRPVVLEVKSTGYRGEELIRGIKAGDPEALYPSWTAQLGLYTHHLDVVGLLHIWVRGAMDPFEVPVYWHGGELYAGDIRLRLGGMNVLDFIVKRLTYLEVALETEEDLFPIEDLGPNIYGPTYPSDFPTHHGDQYRVVINKRGKPAQTRTRNGETEKSYRCLSCEARALCYPEFFGGDQL